MFPVNYTKHKEQQQDVHRLISLVKKPIENLCVKVEEITGNSVAYEIDKNNNGKLCVSYLIFEIEYGNHYFKVKCFPFTNTDYYKDITLYDAIEITQSKEAYNWFIFLKDAESAIVDKFRKEIEPLIPESIWESCV